MRIGAPKTRPDAEKLGGTIKKVIDEMYDPSDTTAVAKMTRARHRLEDPALWELLDSMANAAFDAVEGWDRR